MFTLSLYNFIHHVQTQRTQICNFHLILPFKCFRGSLLYYIHNFNIIEVYHLRYNQEILFCSFFKTSRTYSHSTIIEINLFRLFNIYLLKQTKLSIEPVIHVYCMLISVKRINYCTRNSKNNQKYIFGYSI
jgi:hypothetical protein